MDEEPFASTHIPPRPVKGRGALSNAESRFSGTTTERQDDGWWPEDLPPVKTTVGVDTSKTILAHNQSPDIPFDRSLNAYRGCEHGCIYCYARPTHAYLGLSPGLDFETRLFAKPDAAALLRKALSRKNYRPSPIAIGANTDPYQPIERQYRITRQVLEVLLEYGHPVTITTKSALIERDIGLLAALAAQDLVQVQMSITTLDKELARTLEPRATAPQRRLEAVAALAAAQIPTAVMVAPVIPVLTDGELEKILADAADAGARQAAYIMLRLPLELTGLLEEWLRHHAPLKADHVIARIKEVHGGQPYRSEFGVRQTGTGAYADMIAQRFRLALKRLGLEPLRLDLATAHFHPPVAERPVQTSLF